MDPSSTMEIMIRPEHIGAFQYGAEAADDCARDALASSYRSDDDGLERLIAYQRQTKQLRVALHTTDRPEGELRVSVEADLVAELADAALAQFAYELCEMAGRLGCGPADYRRALNVLEWLGVLAESAETARVEAIMGPVEAVAA